jgi:hypothetical protein
MNFFQRLFMHHCIVDNPTVTKPKNFDEKYYYPIDGTCDNCNYPLHVFVKKGLYVKYEVSNIRCPNCGCKVDRGSK